MKKTLMMLADDGDLYDDDNDDDGGDDEREMGRCRQTDRQKLGCSETSLISTQPEDPLTDSIRRQYPWLRPPPGVHAASSTSGGRF